MRRMIRLALPLAAVVSLSCGSGPKAGDVVMELITPTQDLGAISFTVTAVQPEVIDTVTAVCGACEVFLLRRSATEVDGVVTGPLVPGPLLRLTVSDVQLPEAYAAQVHEAATRDYALTSVAAIRVEIPQ